MHSAHRCRLPIPRRARSYSARSEQYQDDKTSFVELFPCRYTRAGDCVKLFTPSFALSNSAQILSPVAISDSFYAKRGSSTTVVFLKWVAKGKSVCGQSGHCCASAEGPLAAARETGSCRAKSATTRLFQGSKVYNIVCNFLTQLNRAAGGDAGRFGKCTVTPARVHFHGLSGFLPRHEGLRAAPLC